MLLNVVETGTGEEVALLLHGMMGSAHSWWRVAPELAARGYRVLAVDLPGHGESPRDPACSVVSAAAAVVDTVHACAPGRRISAIGHSFGGTVLSAAAAQLPLDFAVYVDTACSFRGGEDRAELIASYEVDRQLRRNADWLRESRPFYSETDAIVEAIAADRFDAATAASISCGDDEDWSPASGSLLIRAEPSRFVSDEDASRLGARGIEVRSIAGATHTIWYSHFDEFLATIAEMSPRRSESETREHRQRADGE